MKWMERLNENIKKTVRSWLNVLPANPFNFQVNEMMDFEGHAILNRIWYRGDGNELEQIYQQNAEFADKHKFWASRSTPGMDMRKIHTGLPGLTVKVLSFAVLPDMNEFEFEQPAQEQLWKEIEEDNKFYKKIESALKETLFIGDGAFKVAIDTTISEYPILEWYPGERVEFVYQRDRIREIVFKTPYKEKGKVYVLNERFLTDKVFCKSRTVTHIIIAYLVLVVDKFLETGKPFLLNGFHFIADRRTLQFKYHAAVGVDFPKGHITVYIKGQLIVSNLNLFFMFNTELLSDFLKIHRTVEPVARVTVVLVMIRFCIV